MLPVTLKNLVQRTITIILITILLHIFFMPNIEEKSIKFGSVSRKSGKNTATNSPK